MNEGSGANTAPQRMDYPVFLCNQHTRLQARRLVRAAHKEWALPKNSVGL